ncbi:MAG: amidohydrolase/deacetylase family metallohydrolase [Chloroflexota bacterium]
MPLYDLLIRGGEVWLPDGGGRRALDVAIAGERIAALGPGLPTAEARQVFDARGGLVTPGLIDLHTHLGFEVHRRVVAPEDVCPASGVTTAVDMGSVGAFAFPWYRERVLERTAIRLFAFINIASLGTTAIHTPYYVEHYGEYVDVADTRRMIEENRARIRGIKVFATGAMVGEWALPALRAARQVGDATGVPVAVHISVAPPSLAEILELLRPGDIITHTLTPHNQGILDAQGLVLPEVRAARARGVLFDQGHGSGSFSFDVARRAMAQGFLPDSISTDVYYANIERPVKDLLTTMSKFLNLGLSLEDVLQRVTANPARAISAPELGQLAVGGPADVAVLAL